MDETIFKSDNLQIMPVMTVFAGLMDFYKNNLFTLWEQAKTAETNEEKLELLNKIYSASKDNDLDGVPFVWREYTIDGNDGNKCVVGTILDVTNSQSRIYDCYKRFTAGFKYLIYLYSGLNTEDIRQSWDQYAGYEFSESGAISLIDDAINDATKEGGIFETIINLARDGQWKIL